MSIVSLCRSAFRSSMSSDAKRRRRLMKGVSWDYSEAVEHGFIDSRIRHLVAAFNVTNTVRTSGSCEGQRWPFCAARKLPYVTFYTRDLLAGQLAMRVQDGPCHQSRLNYEWSVQGHFNDRGELWFVLRCESRRFVRSLLDLDFLELAAWADEVFAQPTPQHGYLTVKSVQ